MIAIISQARTGSTRLPNKIFTEVNGKSLLSYHVDRLKKASLPIIIATTIKDDDDIIAQWCESNSVLAWRGSENDVLKRFSECAKAYEVDHVVRVTSDCPFIDGGVIKQAVSDYMNQIKTHKRVFLSNTLERTFPRGFDFEIFPTELLFEANDRAIATSEREHVTPYIWKGKIKDVHFVHFKNTSDNSHYRLTVDTSDDLNLISKLISDFGCDRKNAQQIIEIMRSNPNLNKINEHVEQKRID